MVARQGNGYSAFVSVKKKKDNGSDESKVYFTMTYLAHWCFLQLKKKKMTAREQTAVSLFRVMQNSSDLFSLIANSGAPHARGAPFLRKFGNLIHPRSFGCDVSVRPATVRCKPMSKVTLQY